MAATADTIWRVPAYLPYLQPPLTDKAVAAVEREIGYRLPAEYLALLRTQNGGYIRYSLPEMVHDSIAGIGPHFPSLEAPDWEEIEEDVSFPLRGLVPFDGDGHWHLCLDYRENPDVPAVTYADVECDRELHIADSFADYLALLRIDDRDWFVLEGSEIEAIQAHLSSALGIRFDPPDTLAHGYPVYRARLGRGNTTRWLWISPNTVPRGFVRPKDRRYAELKDRMPGLAQQFPEAPAGSYLLSATDRQRSRVIEACVRGGVRVRPLRDYLTEADRDTASPG